VTRRGYSLQRQWTTTWDAGIARAVQHTATEGAALDAGPSGQILIERRNEVEELGMLQSVVGHGGPSAIDSPKFGADPLRSTVRLINYHDGD